MADSVYSEGASGDTTSTSYPSLAGSATFSGTFDAAKLVSGTLGPYYQNDSDYFGVPIGSAGVQPGQTLRFTITGLPSGNHFTGRYTFVTPGQKPDFNSNIQYAITGSSGVVTVPTNVASNATLVLQLSDVTSLAYSYGVSVTGGAGGTTGPITGGGGSGGGGGTGVTPTTPPADLPSPIGQNADGTYVYDLGNGIANVTTIRPRLRVPSKLRVALAAYVNAREEDVSPGYGAISLDSWGLNGKVVGDYDGPGSFPGRLQDLPDGTNTAQVFGTDTATDQPVRLDLPVTITKGIADEPYATRIDDVLGDYLNGNEEVTASLDIRRNGTIYARETTTRVLDTDEVTNVKDFRGLIDEYERTLQTDRYDGSGDLQTSNVNYRDGTSTGTAYAGGQTLTAGPSAALDGQDLGQTSFVFSPGYGNATVYNLLVAGSDHDTIALPSADFANVADVLRNTTMVNGSAVITDSTTQESITLQSVTKAQMAHHRGDFTFG